MMDINKLPANTKSLWQRLQHEPLLQGFVLIGGTALTLRIGHRTSEDLDFAYLGAVLPRLRLNLLRQTIKKEGGFFELNQDIAAEHDFLNAGLDLNDHQQNYLATGNVKVSFVRLDAEITALLSGNELQPLRVATLDEIFKTKALVCADRSKSRDWFDLYILLTQHGYTIQDMYLVFEQSGRKYNFDTAAMRLRACRLSPTDEGYVQLLEHAPTLSEIGDYFNAALDQWQTTTTFVTFKTHQTTLPIQREKE